MKVLVTGATGLIGAHTTMGLLDNGHDVRLLARSPQRAKQYFNEHGYDIQDIVEGDMLDAEIVREALTGCNAVVHAAGLVCLDPKQADTVYHTNVNGMRNVLGIAHTMGIDRMVYTSSISALFDGDKEVDVWGPLNESTAPYARSKIACEAFARELQEQGVPLRISYPGMVLGPDDPGLTTSNKGLLQFIELMVPITTSGVQIVDVRDVAELHVRLLEAEHTLPATEYRYVVAGNFHDWRDVTSIMNRVLEKPILSPPCPGVVLRALGHVLDALRKVIPHQIPLTVESANLVTLWKPIFSERTTKILGKSLRPTEETIVDTLTWANRKGHIACKMASTGGHNTIGQLAEISDIK
ncbi:3 beta-hydroxysteroid dehydrogenase/Delta 5--_4-isomerase [BD1-7 clade bacterium]|uniref:3 beta-hydroxysteroid dehydrogenase/Delta 5-->4-isomerase n=1 Tax=BD1-7 clade bacterium TaxID=2029982 RepID=A0A5S9PTY5_9GAMM|nr:3 beta-hydroxysteroid dehydrogenase/Delta 5-->4-isomerase [BD1-7 clade bacterium]